MERASWWNGHLARFISGRTIPTRRDQAKNKSKSAPNTPYFNLGQRPRYANNLQPINLGLLATLREQPANFQPANLQPLNLQKKTPNRGLVHQNFVNQTVEETN
ncbi:hypothetical protein BJP36_32860 [Moorena producens JHB]|uniref:Uncharacterized protein n=1 Tax=Moorena producens (strain JHB) TaxID=1454205 RepID=A0A1D9G8Q0_MOOP1|nr:hypothetical protein BJP36_32860 [Moorena producens JHB]